MRLSSWCCGSLVALVACGSAYSADKVGTDYTLRLQPTAWFVMPGGDLAYNDDGSPDFDKIDFGKMDLDGFTAVPAVDVSINLPLLFSVHAGVVAFNAESDVNLSDSVDFGGQTFSGDVTSDVGILDIYAEIDWHVLNLDMGGASLGIALHAIQSDVTLSQSGSSEEIDESVFVPALAARAYANPLTDLAIEAKAQFMFVDIGDVDVSFYDVSAQAVYRPWNDHVGIVLGARAVRYDVQYDKDDDQSLVDMWLVGAFAGLALQF